MPFHIVVLVHPEFDYTSIALDDLAFPLDVMPSFMSLDRLSEVARSLKWGTRVAIIQYVPSHQVDSDVGLRTGNGRLRNKKWANGDGHTIDVD